MDNPMMHHHGQQGHPSSYFISSYGGGGGSSAMDQKIFGNPLISGGLNLRQNGLSLSNGLDSHGGGHPTQYHHPIMIPMSMMDRSPPGDSIDIKVKRESSSPLTSSDGSFEPDNERSSWAAQQGQHSPNVGREKKRRRSTVTSESTRSSRSPGFEQPQSQSAVSGGMSTKRRDQNGDRRAFGCEQCPKRFAQKAGLIQHERRHSGERPFPCRHCDKKFTQKSGLVQHERLHTGEKPYECTECDKKFTQKSGLVQHIRTHTGEKPYKCEVCGKCFTQLSGLKQHGKVHSRATALASS